MTDFRALCAELRDELEQYLDGYLEADAPDENTAETEQLLNRARAALAQPKPPSLKEQALQALSEAVKMADDVPPEGICSGQADIIRRALEQLPDAH